MPPARNSWKPWSMRLSAPRLCCCSTSARALRQLAMVPLDGAKANELLRDLLGDDNSLALVRRNIAERAQGNPFFLEELVHSLIERGELVGERGAYRLKGGMDTI